MKRMRAYSLTVDERGSASIEATISLLAFTFVIVAIYMLVNFCVVQARVAYAIDATAKEMSQYTYFYHVLGLDSVDAEIDQKKEQAVSTFESINSAVSGASAEVSEVGSGQKDYLDKVFSGEKTEDIKDLRDKISVAVDHVSDAAQDPGEFMKSLAAYAGDKVGDQVKSALCATFASGMTRKHFGSSKAEADAYLKGKGIEDGYSGLHFEASSLFKDSHDIEIVVVYTMHLPKILNIDKEVTICQKARTRGWLGGDAGAGA